MSDVQAASALWPRRPAPWSRTASDLLANASVMIVDDNAANITLLQRVLNNAGVAGLDVFTDPREALHRCTDSLPDLLLLDLHMPHLDGFAVLGALRAVVPAGQFLPVLVLTGDMAPVVRQRALAAGAKDFLTKPFDRTEVVLRVCNLLETRALHRQLEAHNADLQAALHEHTTRQRDAADQDERRRKRVEQAFAEGALAMVFQPIVDLTTGQVMGAEALAQFSCTPRRPPNEWFAEADLSGRGTELEVAAVRAAVAELDQLPLATFLSVNVSPRTVLSPDLDELLGEKAAERLVLELTEHTPVEDYTTLRAALEDLRSRGARLAVDDTGAGYAGFQRLLSLRPDFLKLDTVLTTGIDRDPARRSLATALVAFAEETDATIIAEGIEAPAELTTLQDIGVPWGQGFHLARPGPLPLTAVPVAASQAAGSG